MEEKKRNGLTLVELLVVIAIIGIVATAAGGLATGMFRQFNVYFLRQSMHEAEREARTLNIAISRDFRYGFVSGLVIYDDGFSFMHSWYQPSDSTYGTSRVRYRRVPHPDRQGFRTVQREIMEGNVEIVHYGYQWSEGVPIMVFPVAAIQDFAIVPLNANGMPVPDTYPNISSIELHIRTGQVDRQFARTPELWGANDFDYQGRPIGRLDPIKFMISIERTP